MFRITHTQEELEQRWMLCGQLTGPWVAELRAFWESDRQVAVNRRIVADLSDVTFIDESGEKLLSEMGNRGVDFVAAGVETKYLLKHLKVKGERPLRRFITPWDKCCEKPGIIRNRGSE